MSMTRRDFLKRSAVSGLIVGTAVLGTDKLARAADPTQPLATIIDLTKCDGCPAYETPLCVNACRVKNQSRFPEPINEIQNYWPQDKYEDWSEKQGLINRLTPYNWTYIQHVVVEHDGQSHTIHVPRRCMHCDDAPCADVCPFGVIDKTVEGPVVIDTNACFGGAKCRDICPWHIPQRQAGVGIYLDIAPTFAGGGVMYKCDMCHDLIAQGEEPACVNACPTGALIIGNRVEMERFVDQWLDEQQGYVYGRDENGGTSTFYLSKVPFEVINQALTNQEIDDKPGRPAMPAGIGNPLDTANKIARDILIAPAVGVIAAGISAYRIMTKGEKRYEDTEA